MGPSGCYLCNHRYAGSEQRFSTAGFGSVSNQHSSSERKRRDCIAREGPPCLCQINKFESQSVELKFVHLVVHGARLPIQYSFRLRLLLSALGFLCCDCVLFRTSTVL